MKESRITSKGIWWDGQYGGVSKDGNFLMLYRKPDLVIVEPFDVVVCFPDAGHGDAEYCYKMIGDTKTLLDTDEIEYLMSVIDKALPSTGDVTRLTDIYASDAADGLVVTRDTGDTFTIPFHELKARVLRYSMTYEINAPNQPPCKIPALAFGNEGTILLGKFTWSGDEEGGVRLDKDTGYLILPADVTMSRISLEWNVELPASTGAGGMGTTFYLRRRKRGSNEGWSLVKDLVRNLSGSGHRTYACAFNLSHMKMPAHETEWKLDVVVTNKGGLAWENAKFFGDSSGKIIIAGVL